MADNLTNQMIYDKFTELLRSETFGYADELKSGDAGYEDLLTSGAIADNRGKRIPGRDGRGPDDRAKKIGEMLASGAPIYVYRKGELYPREMRFNPRTNQLLVSKNDVTQLAPISRPPEPSAFAYIGNFLARPFGGQVKSVAAWNRYAARQEVLGNVTDARRVYRRMRNDTSLIGSRGQAKNQSGETAYESFLSMLKVDLGYGELFSENGNRALEQLLLDGNIVDSRGNALNATKNGTRSEHLALIGDALYNQKPLYVYKPGEEYPHEVFMDRDGRLTVSKETIDKMQPNVKAPNIFQTIADSVGWRNRTAFAYERADIRQNLMRRLSRPEALEQRRAYNRIKAGEPEKEAEAVQPEPVKEEAAVQAEEIKEEPVEAQPEEVKEQPINAQEKAEEKAENIQPEPQEEVEDLSLDEQRQRLLEQLAVLDGRIADRNAVNKPADNLKPENEENESDLAEAMQEKQQAQEQAAMSEPDILIERIRQHNGGEPVPDTVQRNIRAFYQHAQDAVDRIDEKCRQCAESGEKFVGGSDIRQIVTYNGLKNAIMSDDFSEASLALLGKDCCEEVYLKAAAVSKDMVYAYNYPHNADFFRRNILEYDGLERLTGKFADSMEEMISKNYSSADAFRNALEAADARWHRERSRHELSGGEPEQVKADPNRSFSGRRSPAEPSEPAVSFGM